MVIFLSTCSIAFGSGWHDYQMEIGDGYSLFRNNSMDVGIGKKDNSIILFPMDYEGIGPVTSYQISVAYILTKNKGRKDRNLFEGDTSEEIDNNKDFFFILQKKDNGVFGPYKEIEFEKVAKEKGIEIKEWIIPKNPNYWRPLLGNLMFIALSIPILMIRFFYITIPLLFFIGWIIFNKLKKA